MVRAPGARREVILDRAAALFAVRGVAATTVRQIADEVGILSGSLYHHFDSKEAIVDEIISHYLDDLQLRYEDVLSRKTDPHQQLTDLIVASLEAVEAHPYATRIYQNDVNYLLQFERFGYIRGASRAVQNRWIAVIEAGVATGIFRNHIDPKILYRLMRDAIWLSVRWFKPSGNYPISQLARDCTSMFLDGLLAPTTEPSASR